MSLEKPSFRKEQRRQTWKNDKIKRLIAKNRPNLGKPSLRINSKSVQGGQK